MCIYLPVHVCSASHRVLRASEPLEPESQAVVSPLISKLKDTDIEILGTDIQILVLCKSTRHS